MQQQCHFFMSCCLSVAMNHCTTIILHSLCVNLSCVEKWKRNDCGYLWCGSTLKLGTYRIVCALCKGVLQHEREQFCDVVFPSCVFCCVWERKREHFHVQRVSSSVTLNLSGSRYLVFIFLLRRVYYCQVRCEEIEQIVHSLMLYPT
jgi:hypothetical protein